MQRQYLEWMEQHSDKGGLRGALQSVADRLLVRQPQPWPWPCSHSPCTGRCTAMPLLRNESQRWLAEAAASQLEEMIGLAASAAAEADAQRASEGEGEGEGEARDFVLGMCIEREQLLTERISPLSPSAISPSRSPTLALQSSFRSRRDPAPPSPLPLPLNRLSNESSRPSRSAGPRAAQQRRPRRPRRQPRTLRVAARRRRHADRMLRLGSTPPEAR